VGGVIPVADTRAMKALSASEIRQVTVSVVARFWDATLGGAPRDEAALADDLSLLVSALTPIPLAVSIGPVPEVSVRGFNWRSSGPLRRRVRSSPRW
jgi:hypothetical protein